MRWTLMGALLALSTGCDHRGAEPEHIPQTRVGAEPDAGPLDEGELARCAPLATHLETLPETPAAEDCAALEGEARFLCGEYWFWRALSFDVDLRPFARDRLSALIAATAGQADARDVGRMHALRGQLTLAIVLENGDASDVADILPDLEAAADLDADNAIIPTWADSMDIALAWRLGRHDELEAIFERTWQNVERCPTGNILSISGTTIGLPLATGAPQKTIELLDRWSCTEAAFCGDNTWRAPYAQPGLAYHFAEAYARVGRTDDARSHLEHALAAPGADTWPYRPFVEDTLNDLDAVVAEFEALGEDGDAFDRMYANQDFGCVFCHAVDPPAAKIRTERLRRPPPPDPDPEPDPDPDPDPDPVLDGECTNDADQAALVEAGALEDVMTQCALQCFGRPEGCPATCIGEAVGLTDPCAGCFGQVLSCTLMHCALVCADPNNPDCRPCQEASCLPAFTECAGLAAP